jgi:hypothetical protein
MQGGHIAFSVGVSRKQSTCGYNFLVGALLHSFRNKSGVTKGTSKVIVSVTRLLVIASSTRETLKT